jgi:hypothetical protein
MSRLQRLVHETHLRSLCRLLAVFPAAARGCFNSRTSSPSGRGCRSERPAWRWWSSFWVFPWRRRRPSCRRGCREGREERPGDRWRPVGDRALRGAEAHWHPAHLHPAQRPHGGVRAAALVGASVAS